MKKLLFIFCIAVISSASAQRLINPYQYSADNSIQSMSPTMWANMTQKNYYSSTVDYLGRIVDAVTNLGTNGVTITSWDATTGKKPQYNREGFWMNGVTGLKSGAVSDYKFISDGTAFTLYTSFKVIPVASSASNYVIARTNSGTNSTIGFNLVFTHNTGISRSNTIQFTITNGTAAVINIISTQNAVTQDAYNTVKITYDGTVATMFCNGTQVATQTRSLTHNTANSTNVLNIDIDHVGNLNSGMKSYMKHFIMWNSLLNSTQLAQVDTYLAKENLNVIVESPCNIYLGGGQSNWDGRGENSAIAVDLVDPTPAFTYFPPSNSPSTASYWEVLRKEVSTPSNNTLHGMNMRWGKNMWTATENFYIIAYGRSGTDLSSDWNYPSGADYVAWLNNVTNGLLELKHVMRLTPVIRSFVWMQGEADAQGTGATYNADLDELIRGVADDVNALSSTAKMRVTIMRIRDQSPLFNPAGILVVRAAQVDVGNNFLTNNPSYSTKVLSTRWVDTDTYTLAPDLLHYDADGLDDAGVELSTYYATYATE